MKKIFKWILEIGILLVVSAMISIYVTICAEHGFQTYPEYVIEFGLAMFFLVATALVGVDLLVDQLQKERKKNK